MNQYQFTCLSPADWEDLCADLIGAHLNLRFQVHTAGRDGGIDLLHGSRACEGTVVQCKHYCRSGFPRLLADLVRNELPKLSKVNPQRYIVATSVSLTPGNKEEIRASMSPWCRGVDDVIGADDIRALLRRYPEIEKTHHKLWLTSIAMMESVLHGRLAVWNRWTRAEIERLLSTYVETPSHQEAHKLLHEHHYCVLTGIPGIGKTTLAHMLAAPYLNDGYELVWVQGDFQDALTQWKSDHNQVFLLDDFLGQTCLREGRAQNEDGVLLRLLAHVRDSTKHRAVLTTREYILEEAKHHSDKLRRCGLESGKCVLKLEGFTRQHRAQILYNHLYFSDLPQECVELLISTGTHKKIVDHPNYNPRLVEWMTGTWAKQLPQPGTFPVRCLEGLSNPGEIWAEAYRAQLVRGGRELLLALASASCPLPVEVLRGFWLPLRRAPGGQGTDVELVHEFDLALRQLDGNFIRTRQSGDSIAVEFHNPSINDFVRMQIVSTPALVEALVKEAQTFEQVQTLLGLRKDRESRGPAFQVCDPRWVERVLPRVFDGPSAAYFWRRTYARGGQAEELGTNPVDLGSRLSQIAAWQDADARRPLLHVALECARLRVCDGRTLAVATFGSCEFLAAILDQHGDSREDLDPVILTMLESLELQLDADAALECWVQWSSMVKRHPKVFSEEQHDCFYQLASDFCFNELKALIEHATSASNMEEWYDDVRSLADGWGLPTDALDRKFSEAHAECTKRESRNGADEWEERGSAGPLGYFSDAHLERLFSTLRSR